MATARRACTQAPGHRERPAFETFVRQPIPRHIPHQDFHHATVTADKHEGIAAERIAIELLAHQRRQAIDALAHVRWRTCEKDALAMR